MKFEYHHLVPKERVANLHFREQLLTRCGEDLEFRAFIKHICSLDYLFLIDTFIWQINPTAEDNIKIAPWISRDYQVDFFSEELNRLDTRLEKSDVAIVKSRKMGLTWMILIMFICFWLFAPKSNPVSWGLTSKTLDDVDKSGNPGTLFAKVKFILEHLPNWMLPNWHSVDSIIKNDDTGSTFIGDASTDDMFRSGRVDASLHDEFGFLLEALARGSLTSTGAVTDIRYVLSTPNGRNCFYRFYLNAGVSYDFLWTLCKDYTKGLYTSTSRDNGRTFTLKLLDTSYYCWVFQQQWGEDKKSKWVRFPEDYDFILDGVMRSPWYDTQESRYETSKEVGQELGMSFGGSDDLYFNYNFIQVLINECATEPIGFGEMSLDGINHVQLDMDTYVKPNMCFWFDAVIMEKDGFKIDRTWLAEREFVVGSDISYGSGAANSVSVVYDKATGEKVARLKSPFIDPGDFAIMNAYICEAFNGALHIYDATGFIGEKTYGDALRATGYSYVYYRESGLMGYNLNPKARSDLLFKYKKALSQRTIHNRSKEGLEECLEFVKEPGGLIIHRASKNNPMPDGARDAHGDEVIADALVAFVVDLNFENAVDINNEVEIPVGCLAWELQQIEEAKNRNNGSQIPERYRRLLGGRR